MRLHHGMALQGRRVDDVDLDRGAGERGCKVTNRAIGSRTITLVWHEGSIEVRTERISSARAVIFHTDQVSSGSGLDRKSTRLNSSHVSISYAVFCLKKKK